MPNGIEHTPKWRLIDELDKRSTRNAELSHRLRLIEHLAQDLIDAVKASEPEAISNDLGNAVAAMEDALKERR